MHLARPRLPVRGGAAQQRLVGFEALRGRRQYMLPSCCGKLSIMKFFVYIVALIDCKSPRHTSCQAAIPGQAILVQVQVGIELGLNELGAQATRSLLSRYDMI